MTTLPLLVTMGATEAGTEEVMFPITGFAMSTMTKIGTISMM